MTDLFKTYIDNIKKVEKDKKELIKDAESSYFKPLDIVRTIYGSIAMIKETNDSGTRIFLSFIGPVNENDYNAWREPEELIYLDNLPRLLASGLVHPFGKGKEDVIRMFDNKGDRK